MRNSRTKRAFTLIELLVVITIIVVLLSLLTPALDKAIYHAELAQCSAKLDNVCTTVTMYSMDHDRKYPRTASPRDGGYQPDLIGWRTNGVHIQKDMRPVIEKWIPLKLLHCPLNEELDISIGGNDTDTQVFATYDLWFGWRYDNQPGMFKLGDRFGAYDSATDTTYSFNTLISDKSLEHITGTTSQLSHPDRSSSARNTFYQNEYINPTVSVFDVQYGGPKITQSRWRQRKDVADMNFGQADGGVVRINGMTYKDERLKPAPAHANVNNAADWDIKLPN